MTTRIQRRVARCEVSRSAETGICHCHANQATKADAAVHGLSRPTRLAGVVCEPEKELKS